MFLKVDFFRLVMRKDTLEIEEVVRYELGYNQQRIDVLVRRLGVVEDRRSKGQVSKKIIQGFSQIYETILETINDARLDIGGSSLVETIKAQEEKAVELKERLERLYYV